MNTFDKYLFKKDNLLRRRIEIDNSLYEQLVKLTEIYDTSINKLVNIAIIEMIRTENVNVYEKINQIFASIHHVYKSNVLIHTRNGEIKTTIVGKSGNYLLTLNGDKINMLDITDIERIWTLVQGDLTNE